MESLIEIMPKMYDMLNKSSGHFGNQAFDSILEEKQLNILLSKHHMNTLTNRPVNMSPKSKHLESISDS